MLRVLRHYLPLRKAQLVVSETLLLTAVVFAGMSLHLWAPSEADSRTLAISGLSAADARLIALVSALTVALLCQVAISFNELYDFRLSSSRYERWTRFLGTAGSAIVLNLLLLMVVQVWSIERVLSFPALPFSHQVVLLTFCLTAGFFLLYFWRSLFHFALQRFNFNERLLILGSGEPARVLAEEVLGRIYSGYEVAGIVSGERWNPAGPAGTERRRSWAPRGRTSALVSEGSAASALLIEDDKEGEEPEHLTALVDRLDIDTVVVALHDRRGSLPSEELLQCRLAGVAVEEYETLYERITGKIAVDSIRPSYLIFNPGFAQDPLREAGKRVLDLALALIVFALVWPAMIVVAILVRLDSPGPVLFRQERVGKNGVPFVLCKFRSMRQDAEKGTGAVWAQADDPRVTRVGGFLRRTRLDELPQLFNVLVGSMSMVGPRPERPEFVANLAQEIPYFEQRHVVKPGLTGWAQINYPYGNTVEDARQKLQFDLFYIKHHSLLFDLSILFNTIKTVVLRRGT